MTIEEFAAKGTELKNALSLNRLVGLKFCKSLDEIPAKAKRPMRDFGFHMAICQAWNQSRTTGYTIGLDLADNYCLAGAAVFGFPIDFKYTFFPQHVKDEAAAEYLNKEYYKRYDLLPKETVAVVTSPFDRLLIEPDIILAYGNPGQVGRIAKALTWHGVTTSALYFGGAGCSAIVLSHVEQKPVLCVPAGGEKLLAGTHDSEMDIVFPASMLDMVLTGFKGTQRMLPYPTVCTTLLHEPVVPDDYHITYKELAK